MEYPESFNYGFYALNIFILITGLLYSLNFLKILRVYDYTPSIKNNKKKK